MAFLIDIVQASPPKDISFSVAVSSDSGGAADTAVRPTAASYTRCKSLQHVRSLTTSIGLA